MAAKLMINGSVIDFTVQGKPEVACNDPKTLMSMMNLVSSLRLTSFDPYSFGRPLYKNVWLPVDD